MINSDIDAHRNYKPPKRGYKYFSCYSLVDLFIVFAKGLVKLAPAGATGRDEREKVIWRNG